MRILILSCNTGGGHNSAAAAVKEYFETRGISCEIKDALAFDSQIKSNFISWGHVFVYKRVPRLFGMGYKYTENHPPKPGKSSIIYNIVKKGAESLHEFLADAKEDFDIIVSTHIFASMILTEVRRKYFTKFKTYFIATDYTCSPGVDEIDADAMFIPHKALISDFTGNGIPEEKIVPTGIPVKRTFYDKTDADTAKEALGLPKNKRIVLMMCGSMGCGPLRELAFALSQSIPEDTALVVICGNNERLYEKFQKFRGLPNVFVIGFTRKISLYMDAASVILTKPGGLSSTEAATKGLPMVLIDAVPGCESKNMDFFIRNGFAVTDDTVEGLVSKVNELLQDKERAQKMSLALYESFAGYAAEKIGSYILGGFRSEW